MFLSVVILRLYPPFRASASSSSSFSSFALSHRLHLHRRHSRILSSVNPTNVICQRIYSSVNSRDYYVPTDCFICKFYGSNSFADGLNHLYIYANIISRKIKSPVSSSKRHLLMDFKFSQTSVHFVTCNFMPTSSEDRLYRL